MYLILVYDVNEKRVGKVCKYLRRHLTWIQNSVFEGELTKAQWRDVHHGLLKLIDTDKDSVLVYMVRDEKWMEKKIIGIEKNPNDNII